TRVPAKNVTPLPRPDGPFVDGMPIPFRDTLPPRIARFKGKNTEPKPDHEVSYAEVDSWLKAPPSWRRGFVERFRPRLKDQQFHDALEKQLGTRPEWDEVLHPEDYEDKTKPAAPNAPTTR